jgi:hypothetical protein
MGIKGAVVEEEGAVAVHRGGIRVARDKATTAVVAEDPAPISTKKRRFDEIDARSHLRAWCCVWCCTAVEEVETTRRYRFGCRSSSGGPMKHEMVREN